MRRPLCRTILLAVMAAPQAMAQSRIPSVPVPGSFFGSSTFGHGPRAGVLFTPPVRRSNFVPRHVFVPRAVFVPVPFYYPYGYGYGFNDPGYASYAQGAAPAAQLGGQSELEGQIESLREEVHALREERLQDEVDRLKEERSQRQESEATREDRAPAPAPSRFQAKPAPHEDRSQSPALTLVFRDGHQLEVRKYAIVGKTLWNFSEDTARKIPLSSLDLDATAKLNEQRGVEFPLPDNP